MGKKIKCYYDLDEPMMEITDFEVGFSYFYKLAALSHLPFSNASCVPVIVLIILNP